jgi:hypothetical protein
MNGLVGDLGWSIAKSKYATENNESKLLPHTANNGLNTMSLLDFREFIIIYENHAILVEIITIFAPPIIKEEL